MGYVRDCHQQIHLSMQVDIGFGQRDFIVPYEHLIATAHGAKNVIGACRSRDSRPSFATVIERFSSPLREFRGDDSFSSRGRPTPKRTSWRSQVSSMIEARTRPMSDSSIRPRPTFAVHCTLIVSVAQKRSLVSAAFQSRQATPGVPCSLSRRTQVPRSMRPNQYQPIGILSRTCTNLRGSARPTCAAAAIAAANFPGACPSARSAS